MKREIGWMVLSFFAVGCESLSSPLEGDPDDVPMAQILTLSASRNPPEIPADGASTDTLTAWLPAKASTRVVTFSATRGSFLHYGSAQGVSVRAERSGTGGLAARIVLRADTLPGVSVVRATVGPFSDFIEVKFVPTASSSGGGAP